MAPLLYCLILLYQTGLTDADCSVTGCNSTFCDGNKCSQCTDPFFRYGDSCRQCFLHCRLCDGYLCYRCSEPSCHYACEIANCPSSCVGLVNKVCPNCPDGFYKYSSGCFRCLHSGCKCYSAVDCIDCLPGRYDNASNCKHTCPSECITCTSIKNCSKCVAGKYGPACESNCITLCEDGSCAKDSGICSSGCLTNQFLDSKQVCRSCPRRCSSCRNFTYCISCSSSNYWGPVCEMDCMGCVDICSKDTGCFLECATKYYREYSIDLNGYICYRCPETCKNCNSSSRCTVCETGYWGSYCQQNCTNCLSACEKTSGCTAGCFSGYYQNQISGGMQCEKCPDNCSMCKNSSVCSDCKAGYYLSNGMSCITCSQYCKNGKCITYNGTCNEGCINGWTGAQCNHKCPFECEQCKQFSSSICNSCIIGYHGTSCGNRCSKNCKIKMGAQVCQASDGECLHGCKAGHWGSTCSSECGRGCYGSLCNQTTGLCVYGCINNFTGIRCDRKELYTYTPEKAKAEPYQHVGTDSDGKSTNNEIVLALSVVAGSVVLLALVAVVGVIMLFKKRQLVFIRNKGNTSAPEPQSKFVGVLV